MFSALKCLKSEGSNVSTRNWKHLFLGFKTVVFVALPYFVGVLVH